MILETRALKGLKDLTILYNGMYFLLSTVLSPNP